MTDELKAWAEERAYERAKAKYMEKLDKIRAEIEKTTSRYTISRERGAMGQVEWSDRLIKESEVLQIIDKYKAESEDKGVLEQLAEKQNNLLATTKAWSDAIEKNGYVN